MKPILDTRPIFHHCDETTEGHVICGCLALVLRNELHRRLLKAGITSNGPDIKQDLQALQEITIADRTDMFAIRTECRGTCGNVFQAVGMAIFTIIRKIL